jgi:hypothetical protein
MVQSEFARYVRIDTATMAAGLDHFEGAVPSHANAR